MKKGFTTSGILYSLLFISIVAIGAYTYTNTNNLKSETDTVKNNSTQKKSIVENNELPITDDLEKLHNTALVEHQNKSDNTTSSNQYIPVSLATDESITDTKKDNVSVAEEGGLGGTGKDITVADGGIGGTAISVDTNLTGLAQVTGSIKGIGSIFVNGIKFNTDQARIDSNGELITDSSLHTGMIVTVDGYIDASGSTGIAANVQFNYDYQGTITDINLSERVLSVNNIDIVIDDFTVINPSNKHRLSKGAHVAISGLIDAESNIIASYVSYVSQASVNNQQPDALSASLSGYIKNHDTVRKTFYIGPRLVNYSGASLIDFPETGIKATQLVKITGVVAVDKSIRASRVEYKEPESETEQGSQLAVEGIVTNVLTLTRYVINDQVVNITANTQIVNGELTDIVLNAALKAEGALDKQGELTAQQITFPVATDIHIETNVVSVDVAANIVILEGINLPAKLNNNTLIFDSSVSLIHAFSLQDLQVGDRVIVYGKYNENIDPTADIYQSGIESDFFAPEAGEIIATRFERVDKIQQSKKIIIQGRFYSLDNNPIFFRLFGLLVSTSSDSTVYLDQDGQEIGRRDFFDVMEHNMIVYIEGKLKGWVIEASKVQIAKP